MNREDIIRMAREAFDVEIDARGRETFSGDEYGIERFATLVAEQAKAEEREACAKRLDSVGCDHCAENIRKMGQA